MRKPQSLRGSRDLVRLLTEGASSERRGVTVYAARRTGENETRLGLIVKTRRGAAHRNRIKRRLREAFRRVQVAGGYDIVIRAGTEAATRKFSELERDIDDAMNEAKARAQRASVARTDGIRR